MKILVVDVAASASGALTVLKQYHTQFSADAEHTYYFCVSTPELPETKNIRVLSFPWVKKSWLHRLWFDHVTAPGLLKKHAIDRVFSLQNTAVPHTRVSQTVFLHQSLPFTAYRFRFSESKISWIYQNVISKVIYRSLKKAEKIIVQTQWIKRAIMETCGIHGDKIEVSPPPPPALGARKFADTAGNRRNFLYPAIPVFYKNHRLILQACEILKEKGFSDFSVRFTISGDENTFSRDLKAQAAAKNLPVVFGGPLPQDKLFDAYTNSVLLFPSYVETFGLPLLEARTAGTYVLASDCPFSREILEGYDRAALFDPFDAEALAKRMRALLEKS
jgi:glycosyltransferase involved in cell wall biosynthesis